MAQDYKITQFDASTAQISVYFIPLGFSMSIDLPLDENRCVPVGEELDVYIKGFLPYGVVARQQALANGVANVDAIAALIESV